MKKEIIAGVTEAGELYVLNIETQSGEHDYFAMSGSTSMPIKIEHAKDRVRERLEDSEEWRYAVQSEKTELGLTEWIDFVLDTDGALAGFDNSLFPDEVSIGAGDEMEEWIFESGSCGQQVEETLAHYFIGEARFRALMGLWKQYHLKPEPTHGTARMVLNNTLEIEQDRKELAERAVWLYKENQD